MGMSGKPQRKEKILSCVLTTKIIEDVVHFTKQNSQGILENKNWKQKTLCCKQSSLTLLTFML